MPWFFQMGRDVVLVEEYRCRYLKQLFIARMENERKMKELKGILDEFDSDDDALSNDTTDDL